MNREKETIKAAYQRTMEIFGELDDFQDVTEGFIDGAKWADKTMIDKACEWLLNIDYDSLRYRDFGEEFNEELFVNDFLKAMEE